MIWAGVRRTGRSAALARKTEAVGSMLLGEWSVVSRVVRRLWVYKGGI